VWADGRTDERTGMTKLIVAFLIFAKTPKKWLPSGLIHLQVNEENRRGEGRKPAVNTAVNFRVT
jgi:hypothetical protein